jgi:formate hydrogenlyase subunit 3/multisubunit Na+/H+ antiporter MnhD subunit
VKNKILEKHERKGRKVRNTIGIPKVRNTLKRSFYIAATCGILIVLIGLSLKYTKENISGMTQFKGAGWRNVVMDGNNVLFLGIIYLVVVLAIWKLDKK